MPRGVYKRTKEYREKQSKAHRGRPHKMPDGFVPHNKGVPLTEEQKRNISKKNKGRKLSAKTKKKMSKSRRGEKHFNWQGGKTFGDYSFNWTDTLRESIRQRDNHVCQLCGIHEDELDGFYMKLDIHHIDYIKNNCNPNNLISLCRSCHVKTNYNRDYWVQYFKGALL